jgi:hypothetical protein
VGELSTTGPGRELSRELVFCNPFAGQSGTCVRPARVCAGGGDSHVADGAEPSAAAQGTDAESQCVTPASWSLR